MDGFHTKERSIHKERAFHRQDAKGAKKDNKQCAFAVLLGIAIGDTRDKRKLGVLATWR
jgi:hypothetical protein